MALPRLVVKMCAGQLGSLLPHVVVPAVMVSHLIPAWNLSNTEAGFLAASYTAGYMVAVPWLASMTDRMDARLLLVAGSLFTALATAAFGLFADGLVSGMIFWGLAGLGFAGAYMPGLRALTDRAGDGDISRSITFYTSSYSVGIGFSFLASQVLADQFGWRAAFLVTSAGPLVMAGVAATLIPKPPPKREGALLAIGPVLQNRPALGYILGYGAHCFELAGLRTWIVAFWGFVIARTGGESLPGPIAISVLISLLAMLASLLGNECAMRFGRRRAIVTIQVLSALIALLIAASMASPGWVLLVLITIYAVTVPAESGSLTAGMAASAQPQYKGSTMAMHSTFGFALSSIAGWAVGLALDDFGGRQSAGGWAAAFSIMAAGISLGPLALWWSKRSAPGKRSADLQGGPL